MLATLQDTILKLQTAFKSPIINASPHTLPKDTPTNPNFFNPATEEGSFNTVCDLY